MEQKKRVVYLDALRIIAIMCVIFNHSGANGYFLYTTTESVPIQIISIFISSFCKIGVLLFFMISGALLLTKDESLKDIYVKRVLRYLIILFVFCFLRYIYHVHRGEITFYWKDLIRKITTGQIYTPYWFIYSYIGFLACLPFYRKLVKVLTYNDYIYMIVLYAVAGGIFGVLARTFLGQIVISFPFVGDMLVYPLFGYFIAHEIPKEKQTLKSVILSCIVALIGLSLNVCVTQYDHIIFGDWTEAGLLLFTIFSAIAVFYAVKYFFEHVNVPVFFEKLLCLLGGCSFGVYLLEGYVKDYFGFIQKYLRLFLPGLVAAICYLVCIFLIGSAITFIMKKIPLIRKLF